MKRYTSNVTSNNPWCFQAALYICPTQNEFIKVFDPCILFEVCFLTKESM